MYLQGTRAKFFQDPTIGNMHVLRKRENVIYHTTFDFLYVKSAASINKCTKKKIYIYIYIYMKNENIMIQINIHIQHNICLTDFAI